MKNQIIAIALATALPACLATAAPDPREIHERMFEHLKAIRDHLVPAPVTHFVETFPPVAFPRGKVLQLAQAPPEVIGGGGALQVAGPEGFQVAVPPPPGAPDIDPSGIANWAEGLALSTTQGVFDQLFPRGGNGARRPVIVGGDSKNAALSEDLTVMQRILEKAANAKGDEPPRASGIALFSFGQPGSPRAFYLDGYGAMFVLNVRYPLLAPPKHDDADHTNDTTNSEWEKAKEEVYGRRVVGEIRTRNAQGEEFNAQQVENVKQRIIDDLVNAKNIRNLKSDDHVTVVVLGGGGRAVAGGVVARSPGSPARSVRAGAGAGVAWSEPGADAGAQSTMTLRAKKSDIDAFAKNKLTAEEFRKKVSVQVY